MRRLCEQNVILPYALSGGNPLLLARASDPIQDEDLLITEMQAWGIKDSLQSKQRRRYKECVWGSAA